MPDKPSPEGIDALRHKTPDMGPCDIFLEEARSELSALRHLSKMLQASALTYPSTETFEAAPSTETFEAALRTVSEAAADRAELIERLADYASAEIEWPAV